MVGPELGVWWSGLIKSKSDDRAAAGRVEIDDGFAIPSWSIGFNTQIADRLIGMFRHPE